MSNRDKGRRDKEWHEEITDEEKRVKRVRRTDPDEP